MRFIEFLVETYQEEQGSSFTHNGSEYDLNKLLRITEKFKTRTYKISDFDWILVYSEYDPERLKKADPKVPIIVCWDNGKLVPIDGLHRILKAKQKNWKTIEGKFVYRDVLERCKIKD